MKKTLAILAMFMMLLTISGCSGDGGGKKSDGIPNGYANLDGTFTYELTYVYKDDLGEDTGTQQAPLVVDQTADGTYVRFWNVVMGKVDEDGAQLASDYVTPSWGEALDVATTGELDSEGGTLDVKAFFPAYDDSDYTIDWTVVNLGPWTGPVASSSSSTTFAATDGALDPFMRDFALQRAKSRR